MGVRVGSWAKGAERVCDLIEDRHLQRVIGDPETVSSLLASARRHIDSARLTADGDLRAPTPWPTTLRARAPRRCWPMPAPSASTSAVVGGRHAPVSVHAPWPRPIL